MGENQMIRTLATVGSIVGFIAFAFVPPTDANFRAAEGVAQAQVGVRAVATLIADSGIDRAKLDSAVKVLRDITPEPKTALKRVSTVALTQMKLKKTSAFWKATKHSSEDADLVRRMADIEWAARKQDVRLCIGVAEDVVEGDVSSGDYLALCLAKVTGDSARCAQIDGVAGLLRKLCTEELAT